LLPLLKALSCAPTLVPLQSSFPDNGGFGLNFAERQPLLGDGRRLTQLRISRPAPMRPAPFGIVAPSLSLVVAAKIRAIAGVLLQQGDNACGDKWSSGKSCRLLSISD